MLVETKSPTWGKLQNPLYLDPDLTKPNPPSVPREEFLKNFNSSVTRAKIRAKSLPTEYQSKDYRTSKPINHFYLIDAMDGR